MLTYTLVELGALHHKANSSSFETVTVPEAYADVGL